MPDKSDHDPEFHYAGFSSPNGTIVPDDVFDVLLPHLSDIELRVLLYLIRRTFGFKKDSDDISLRQIVQGITTRDGRVLDRGAGVSKPSAVKAARLLEAKGIIVRRSNSSPEKGDEASTYALRFKGDPVLTGLTRGGKPHLQGGVNAVNTQQTDKQQTVQQQTDLDSNSLDMSPVNPAASRNSKKETQKRNSFASVGALLQERYGDGASNRAESPQKGPKSAGSGFAEQQDPSTEQRPLRGASRAYNATAAANGGGKPTGKTSRGRPPKATEQIRYWISKYSEEFHDEALESSIGQAARLWKASGQPESAFCALIGEAASRTKQAGMIEKRSKQYPTLRNKMPYFFSCLRQLLGVEESPASPSQPRMQDGDRAQGDPVEDDVARFFKGPYGSKLQR
ncbi:MAG: hypothetical protein IT307_13955 [Chloroflexi bacterium]|nr:hypothetical protein [Chloroflexota bacterium]